MPPGSQTLSRNQYAPIFGSHKLLHCGMGVKVATQKVVRCRRKLSVEEMPKNSDPRIFNLAECMSGATISPAASAWKFTRPVFKTRGQPEPVLPGAPEERRHSDSRKMRKSANWQPTTGNFLKSRMPARVRRGFHRGDPAPSLS